MNERNSESDYDPMDCVDEKVNAIGWILMAVIVVLLVGLMAAAAVLLVNFVSNLAA